MTSKTLKSTLAAAAVALSCLAAPVQTAQAEQVQASRDTGVGRVIAAQGNAALRLIRAEVKAAVRQLKPMRPARPARVSLPAGAAASIAATAACAE